MLLDLNARFLRFSAIEISSELSTSQADSFCKELVHKGVNQEREVKLPRGSCGRLLQGPGDGGRAWD